MILYKKGYPTYFLRTCALVTALCTTGCAIAIPVAATTAAGMVSLDERSTGNIIDDPVIVTKVKASFSKSDYNNLLTKISVNSYEGRVMLTGVVKEQKYIDEAVRQTWSIPRVREVINELVVAENPQGKATDMWISSQVKTKFLLEKNFDSLNYSYDVSDGVVYLLGVSQDQNEMDRAIRIAGSIDKVTKVVNHVILKTDKRRVTAKD